MSAVRSQARTSRGAYAARSGSGTGTELIEISRARDQVVRRTPEIVQAPGRAGKPPSSIIRERCAVQRVRFDHHPLVVQPHPLKRAASLAIERGDI